MSERAPSAPTQPEPSPESTSDQATVDQMADTLDDALRAGEQSQQSPTENLAKTRLEGLQNLRNTIGENFVTPTLNTIGKKLDSVRDGRDNMRKKAFMLDRREAAKNSKIDRLESNMATMNPNSRRYRRAEQKLIKTQRKLFWIERSNRRLTGAIENRQNGRDRTEQARENKILIRRELQLIAKIVATEKQRRKETAEKLKNTTSKAEKARLKAEINGWKNIHAIKKDLTSEALKKYKKTYTRKEDYDLAA